MQMQSAKRPEEEELVNVSWATTCLVPMESQFFLSVPGLREAKKDIELSLASSGKASARRMRHCFGSNVRSAGAGTKPWTVHPQSSACA